MEETADEVFFHVAGLDQQVILDHGEVRIVRTADCQDHGDKRVFKELHLDLSLVMLHKLLWFIVVWLLDL